MAGPALQIGSDDTIIVVGTNRGRIGLRIRVEAIDITKLGNFLPSAYVDHAKVEIVAGPGLRGGGDLTETRVLTLDLASLPVVEEPAPTAGVVTDVGRVPFAHFNTTLNHDALTNCRRDEHVPHSKVAIEPGVGLSGGGDLTTTRVLRLALQKLEPIPIEDGLWIPVVDSSGLHGRVRLDDVIDQARKVSSDAIPA